MFYRLTHGELSPLKPIELKIIKKKLFFSIFLKYETRAREKYVRNNFRKFLHWVLQP